jgi:hypothetical protein
MSHVDALMQRDDNVVLKDIFNSKLGIENGGARLWKKGTSARQKL